MPFDDLGALIHQLNIHDDAIIMDSKIRDLADYFQNVFDDEEHLKDVLQQFNRLALDDSKFAMNLALFFASRVLDSAVKSGSQVRAEMLTVLQQNYMDADRLKSTNRTHFHNSITLLGEYYHRARIAASPVKILGQSLLQLLADHLRADIDQHLTDATYRLDVRYAKLILRQITLNGQLARTNHKTEIETLLFEIRRCLVLVSDLCSTTRALLLMTLDLYYSNFGTLGTALETLYVSYLTDEGDDDGVPSDRSATNPVQIGLQAATAETTINSLTGLSDELRKQGSGYQRPPGIKTEFLNRPLRAADRLRFVRQQTASDAEQDNDAFREQQRSFEQTVQQQQIERAAQQPAAAAVSNSQQVPEPQIRPHNTPTKSNQSSPSTSVVCSPTSTTSVAAANTNPNLKHSPRSVHGSPGHSTPTTPTKTPTARRRPLFVPVSPPQNSDWFAEVESHFALGVQQSAKDQKETLPLSPPENSKNHGNGSPNKYSKSLSPGGNVQAGRSNGQHTFSHSHDGENSGQPMSPTKSHRNHRGGRKHRRNNERHNNDSDSMYASKGSLQSLRHSSSGEHRPTQQQQRNNGGNQHGTQLKPANRNNNPFDRRSNKQSSSSSSFSAHSQHCDRGEMPTKYERQGSAPGPGHSSDDQVNSPPQAQPARNPHAAQYAREFLQFLED